MATKTSIKWNDQQRAAIDHRGGELLLSAGAGSGKTAVLTERIAALASEGVPITSMLVVTYTNAAAAEMKRRIRQRLTALSDDPDADRSSRDAARKQVELLSSASISTLHSFCTQLLRRHFQAVGLDPAFRAADDFEADALFLSAVDEVTDDFYEEGDTGFLALADGFGGRVGRSLPDLVKRCHTFLCTLTDRETYLDSALSDVARPPETLENTKVFSTFRHAMAARARTASDYLYAAREYLPKSPEYEKLYAMFDEDASSLERFADGLVSGKLAVDAMLDFSYGRLDFPRGKDAAPAPKETIKTLRDRAKKVFDPSVYRDDAALANAKVQSHLMRQTHPQAAALVRLLSAVALRYNEKKAERGLIDFSDMEHLALKALRDPEIAKEYNERYTHIFIDEYQDSSGLQEELISHLATGRDVFMVGDVKQSIYSFRAAKPSLFTDRQRRAKRGVGRVLPLNINYRTAPSLLGCVNDVFSRAMIGTVKYGEDDALRPGRQDAGLSPLNVLLIDKDAEGDDEKELLTDTENEALLVSQLIKERLKSPIADGAGGTRPCAYSDFAVLLRKTTGASEVFCRVFAQEGIPAYADLTGGYFDAIEVQVLLNLLRICDNRRQDIPLLSVLRAGIGGFSDEELATVRTNAGKRHDDQTERPEPISYFDALCAASQSTDDTGKKCAAFLSLLSEARELSRSLTLSRFIEWLIARTGYDDACAALPGGETRTANIARLISRARVYENASARGLSGFLKYIDDALEAGKDMGEDRSTGGAECVRVMSVHRSKGLEFPVVYFCGAGRRFNTTDSARSLILSEKLGICMKAYLPDERAYSETLFHRTASEELYKEAVDEELRVLYVALTRAREELFAIGSVSRLFDRAKAWLSPMPPPPVCPLDWIMTTTSRFPEATELYTGMGLITQPGSEYPQGLWRYKVFSRADIEKTVNGELGGGEYELWRESALECDSSDFSQKLRAPVISKPTPAKASASSLWHDYSIELMPSPRFLGSERMGAAAIGTATHTVMERLDMSLPLDEDGIRAQTANMEAAGFISNDEASVVNAADMARFFASDVGRRMADSPALLRELPFSMFMPAKELGMDSADSVLVQGVIDACFEDGDAWVLVDYKTDRLIENSPEKTAERHLRQLELYAKALSRGTGKPVKEMYVFLLRAGTAVKL